MLPAEWRFGRKAGRFTMCRWNAYFGQPLLVEELLFTTQHGLIDQSMHARMGVETTNGDGFGWGRAHIRATTGTPVEQSNCHPFRHGKWLFVHNGVIAGFHKMRRELLLTVDPTLFDGIVGSTDSETLFYLLSLGLEDDPLGALERAVGLVEATGRAHGVEHPIQMTVGMSDGQQLGVVRYSTEHDSRTLFVSEHVDALRSLHPDNPRLQRFTDEDRVVLSEPPGDLPGAWLQVPESSAMIIQTGADETQSFQPHWP
jgi:glutamine amidotransferase